MFIALLVNNRDQYNRLVFELLLATPFMHNLSFKKTWTFAAVLIVSTLPRNDILRADETFYLPPYNWRRNGNYFLI